jgi:hypothetical protein
MKKAFELGVVASLWPDKPRLDLQPFVVEEGVTSTSRRQVGCHGVTIQLGEFIFKIKLLRQTLKPSNRPKWIQILQTPYLTNGRAILMNVWPKITNIYVR